MDNVSLCSQDGTWSTMKGSFTIIRDFLDVCFYSYFSIMNELRHHKPGEGKYYEIRFAFFPAMIIVSSSFLVC